MAGREMPLEIPEVSIQSGGGARAFHGEDGGISLGHDEIHLTAVRVPEVAEGKIPAFGILLETDPRQEVTGHEVFEPGARFPDEGPVRMVVFLRFPYRADTGAPKGGTLNSAYSRSSAAIQRAMVL